MHFDTVSPQQAFNEAFGNRSPQQIVASATYWRGYRDGFTNEQFLARQILKMQEELGELTNWILWLEDEDIPEKIMDMGKKCRESFDQIKEWQARSHCQIATVAKNNPNLLRKEMADMQVVLFNMATVIEEITRHPFDVVQAAVDKAKKDVKRGVR